MNTILSCSLFISMLFCHFAPIRFPPLRTRNSILISHILFNLQSSGLVLQLNANIIQTLSPHLIAVSRNSAIFFLVARFWFLSHFAIDMISMWCVTIFFMFALDKCSFYYFCHRVFIHFYRIHAEIYWALRAILMHRLHSALFWRDEF